MPYYATAATETRSHHAEEISNQIRAVEWILQRRDESEKNMSPDMTESKLRENEAGVNKRPTEHN